MWGDSASLESGVVRDLASDVLLPEQAELLPDATVLPMRGLSKIVPTTRTIAACAGMLAVGGFMALVGQHSPVQQIKQTLTTSAAEVVTLVGDCAADGMDCRASNCCRPGGQGGLQCYERDADWAQCAETCVPGMHEEDKATVKTKDGLVKPTWSCKKLGMRSVPGCSSFEETTCPLARCQWKDNHCQEMCSNLDNVICPTVDRCIMNQGSCVDNCWTFMGKDVCLSEENRKRCQWKGDKCTTACWTFPDKNQCLTSTSACLWEGVSCKDDPCSAPGEDCMESKCCSGARGGAGMTCFEQNEYFATCSTGCYSADDGPQKNWTCTKLGKRTKTDPHCAWAGESCASTGLCCNKGFVCAVKDDKFTGCMQVWKQKSTGKKKLSPPPGWPEAPKIVGGGQFEYEVSPAPAGSNAGTSLYCFMGYLPGSYEERLMDIAKANYASIFACDGYDVFKTWQQQYQKWDTTQVTLSNIEVFINVWNQVSARGRLWEFDWTVKVDPDCLIVPQRMKWHLEALRAPKNTPIYVKNNAMNASWGNDGFLGAVEIFSRDALELYFDWWPKCEKTMGTRGGEDGFMKQCMDALGVGYMTDGGMFKPDNDPRLCKDIKWAAYHPIKVDTNYQCCIDEVNGGTHFFEWGYCKDINPGWISKVWPKCDADLKCREPRWQGSLGIQP